MTPSEDAEFVQIRDAQSKDFAAILVLNQQSVQYLSPLDEWRLALLDRQSSYHRVIEVNSKIAAFLLGFKEGAHYDSPNYQWFAARYPSFFYVDRIVVADHQQGHGFGRALYEDFFRHAERATCKNVVCEFDLDPPNEGSRRFHASMGFVEVGTQLLSGANKRVSMQLAQAPFRYSLAC
jgi:uncharacterized protein